MFDSAITGFADGGNLMVAGFYPTDSGHTCRNTIYRVRKAVIPTHFGHNHVICRNIAAKMPFRHRH